MVNFKVARMYNGANGRINSDSDGIRNAVIYADKIQLKGAGSYLIARLNRAQVFGADPILLQTPLQNAQSKCGTVYGAVYLLHDIGQRANMVLVTMGQKDTL